MKVLLVEDQKDVLESWQEEFLSFASEFDLEVATCVVEALEIVERGEIRAAFVDIGLPWDVNSQDAEEKSAANDHGLELLSLLQDAYGIPVIALTGTNVPEVQNSIEPLLVAKPVRNFEEDIIPMLRELRKSTGG